MRVYPKTRQAWDEMTMREETSFANSQHKNLAAILARQKRNRKIRQAIDAIEQEALCKRP